MKSKSDSRTVQGVLVLAAAIAALGVSVGVPVEDALAAQLPDAQGDPAPRTRAVEPAFSLIGQPGQRQGAADSSRRRTEIAAYELYRGQKRAMGDGSVKQGARPGASMRDPGPAGRSRSKNPGSAGRGGIGNRAVRGPGSSRMLNPQPLPPKSRLGAPGG
jgi:hypothetical protein